MESNRYLNVLDLNDWFHILTGPLGGSPWWKVIRIGDLLGKAPKTGPTKVVAASDTPNAEARADYECDGTADDVEIQAALDALPAFGGTIRLLEGTYVLGASITTPADCCLEGNGWATILDMTGGNYGIITGDRCAVRSLKMKGNITPPIYSGIGITVGNHCVVERIWVSESQLGIDIVSKTNVYVRDVRFDHIHDGAGQAPCIHAWGSSVVFVDGIYIDTADRGFEVEAGTKDFYAQNGYLKSIYVAGSYSFTLDVHTHDGEDGVENVVYENFYLEDCYGINITGRAAAADKARNITLKNITIIDPYDGGTQTYSVDIRDAINVNIENLKIRSTTSAGDLFVSDSVDIVLAGLDIDMDYRVYVQGESITIKDSFLRNTGGIAAIRIKLADYVLVDNVHIYDVEGTMGGIRADISCNDIKIRDCTIIAHVGTPGQYAIRIGDATTVDTSILDNNFEGAFTVSGIRVQGTNTVIKGNRGFVTENGGISGAIATGGTIAHGLDETPTIVQVNAAEAGPTDITISVDAANITVNFGGGGNKTFYWYARFCP